MQTLLIAGHNNRLWSLFCFIDDEPGRFLEKLGDMVSYVEI